MQNNERYLADFSAAYHQDGQQNYGNADITTLELKTLKQMLIQEGSREGVIARIIEKGWQQPEPPEVSPSSLAETAVQHACVVAEYLVDQRGSEAGPDTYFSYTTKNQADRYIASTLGRRISAGGDLHEEWHRPHDRENGYQNPNVSYPEGLDSSKIFGIAKPHRYWPAQLLRYLESVRLDKASPEEKGKLKVNDGQEHLYTIPWSEYGDVIDKSHSVDQIAIGIAVSTMEKLKDNGLNDEQVTELILAGYSPGGPMNEHGNIPEVHTIWGGIIEQVGQNQELAHLSSTLESRVEEKIAGLGYKFTAR